MTSALAITLKLSWVCSPDAGCLQPLLSQAKQVTDDVERGQASSAGEAAALNAGGRRQYDASTTDAGP